MPVRHAGIWSLGEVTCFVETTPAIPQGVFQSMDRLRGSPAIPCSGESLSDSTDLSFENRRIAIRRRWSALLLVRACSVHECSSHRPIYAQTAVSFRAGRRISVRDCTAADGGRIAAFFRLFSGGARTPGNVSLRGCYRTNPGRGLRSQLAALSMEQTCNRCCARSRCAADASGRVRFCGAGLRCDYRPCA